MALIGIHGAGSIGCYLGGRLAAAGSEVLLVGRERLRQTLADSGLRVSDYRGADLQLAPSAVRYETSPAALAEADLVLVTVKSAATAQAGRELAAVLRPGTLVISFQNGLGNAAVLARELPEQVVLAGMVPFNVAHQGHGHFHQGSEGELDVAAHASLGAWLPAFARAGLALMPRGNMEAVLWGKLLLNLNNPVNALSGLPLKAELSQRDYRRCLALAQEEALALMAAARIQPARLTPVPPHWIPRLMRVPDPLFRRLANRMLAIDPLARSSMWDDLEAGRTTEIDWINGEVVRLGERLQLPAPVNACLVALVHAAEQDGRRDWPGDALLARLRDARAAAG